MPEGSDTSRTDGPGPAAAPWWLTFFDSLYAETGLGGKTEEENRRVASFLHERLCVEPGGLVFDQCCGIGRISLPLAELGVSVIGVDITPGYVEQARAAAAGRGLDCRFVAGDAFEFVSPEPCDAAFNWFTSFGYDDDDTRNVRMLHRVFESLKPGGRFAVDVINATMMLRRFQPDHIERIQRPEGELLLLVEAEPDLKSGMVVQRWSRVHPDGRREAHEVRTRMLMPHELCRLLETAGFVDVDLLSWPDGDPLTLDSRRCVALCRRG